MNAAKRIRPIFETDGAGVDVTLTEEHRATLTQGEYQFSGRIKVSLNWFPTRLFWEFGGCDCEKLAFGRVAIKAKSFAASGRVISYGRNLATGYLDGQVDVGTDYPVDRAVFHLANYPGLVGEAERSDTVVIRGSATHIKWSEIVLNNDVWEIAIQPVRNSFRLCKQASRQQSVVISGVGEIRRTDNSQFKKKELHRLLDGLRYFLSFAFSDWMPPLLTVGANDVSERTFELWNGDRQLARPYPKGWVDGQHGASLSTAFPGFMSLWENDEWREPIRLAVSWLIHATTLPSSSSGGVAFAQIPLEMLAWMVFVDSGKILGESDFDKISAAGKLQMLLAHCGIPPEIPGELSSLRSLSDALNKREKARSGPQLAAEIRNNIIHPHKKNRDIFANWESISEGDLKAIVCDAQLLYRWYLTLVLLHLSEYNGEYSNRLKQPTIGEVELVPWARNMTPAR